jgi:hypothetical protein
MFRSMGVLLMVLGCVAMVAGPGYGASEMEAGEMKAVTGANARCCPSPLPGKLNWCGWCYGTGTCLGCEEYNLSHVPCEDSDIVGAARRHPLAFPT